MPRQREGKEQVSAVAMAAVSLRRRQGDPFPSLPLSGIQFRAGGGWARKQAAPGAEEMRKPESGET